MSIKIIETEKAFNKDVLASDKPVLVEFFSAACGPCRVARPALETIDQDKVVDIAIVDIDSEGGKALSAQFKIHSIPTFVMVQEGAERGRQVGVVSMEDSKVRLTALRRLISFSLLLKKTV